LRYADVNTLRQLLQRRPMAARLLEETLGGRFWADIHLPLDLFCARYGLMTSDLLDKVATLPDPPEDLDWEGNPLYYLLDRLTAEHQVFRVSELPALRAMLDVDGVPAYPDRYVAGLMLQDFQAFGRAFLGHMAEEEDRIFPDALLDEAVIRFPGLGLKPAHDPLRRRLPGTPDQVYSRMVVDIREKIRLQTVSPASEPRFRAIDQAFRNFEGKLLRHARLETDLLEPRLARIESALAASAAAR
jgi:iron-sulfur cluster repair protein YtfE (RIC family)